MDLSKSEWRHKQKKSRAELARLNPLAAKALAVNAAKLYDGFGAQPPLISGYWPMGSEIDPRPLMQELANLGAFLALPRVVSTPEGLHFGHFSFGDVLENSPQGVWQPPLSAKFDWPDLVLVPLLAFDKKGFRLGYGGGYYDRVLAFLRGQKKVMALGLAYAGQSVDQVPREPHDQPLDGILTEEGLMRL